MADTPSQASYLTRRQKERLEALAKIEEQIKAGKLTIRKMTRREKAFWGPPKPTNERDRKRLRRSLAVPHSTDRKRAA